MYRINSMLRARLLRDGEPGAGPGGPAGGGGTGAGTGGAGQGGGQSGGQPAGKAGTEPGDDQLGEAGKTAIDRERANAREANRLKSAAEERAAALETELQSIREANQSEAEKATAKAVKEATAAAVQAGNARLVRAEVKAAAAAAGFHDPQDASLLLADKFGQVKVADDGRVDDDAIKALVEELATAKPHLVKKPGTGSAPLPGQGSGGGGGSLTAKQAGQAEARRRFGEKTKTTT